MNEQHAILIASDSIRDADMIRHILQDEFGDISVSTSADKAVSDFERVRPRVLILAFASLEKAEAYYLGLFRLGKIIHTLPHRTLLLCHKEELPRVYELCRKGYFDNYIVFWPLSRDGHRLRIEVHHALQQSAMMPAGQPDPGDVARQLRNLSGFTAELDETLAQGAHHINATDTAVTDARSNLDDALNDLAQRLEDFEFDTSSSRHHKNTMRSEIERFRGGDFDREFRRVADAVTPLQQWPKEFERKVGKHRDSLNALQQMSNRVKPLILIVDDDEFQHSILKQLLSELEVQLSFAASGRQALQLLGRSKPDLVLMDIHLPDIDGVEITKTLKANPKYADVPVIMITGDSEKEVVMKSLNVGASDFVVKPFIKDKLIKKIKGCLA